MENKGSSSFMSNLKSLFAAIVIPTTIVVAALIYVYILGNPSNFQGGNPENHPVAGNYLGVIHKGGIIVPIIISLLLMVVTFAIERIITISKASGKGRVEVFIHKIRQFLSNNDVDGAIAECERQKGSIANVVNAGLIKYKQMTNEKDLDKDSKVAAIQKELEETTTLELPMLSKNLIIISTIASIATLMGLLGTVIGMIRAFSALANAGAPDAVALATGISEALINTALGIGTSAVAIILYNFFTNKIDALTYGIDEAGYSVVESFASKYSK